ncbi:hypothetical protein CMV30_01645 [Nibricoccus aquaticus]|uniref:Uncharacterized protein n=1 Tax=Nibricoccus aquaticus TaxID=2576891 RepID=A0A290Q2N3_9BACT|nr:hypothetical protein [Nibricoccus aquaticus]ATC62774.1 hypothetical protein CMV30_01645 [Nibricoccus aquaticus]
MSTNPATKQIPPTLLQWIVWSGITTGLIVIYFTIGQRPAAPTARELPAAFAYVGLFPLLLSAALRWVLLPRVTDPQKRLPLFIAGVALAEGCGVLGIFLGGPHKDTLFALSLLGLAQFFPALLPRSAPQASPFR